MRLLTTRGQRLTAAESQWHDVLRLVLVFQVVFGHLAAIALPTIPQLADALPGTSPYIVYRGLTRFGPQAAFLFVALSGFMVAGPLLKQLQSNAVPRARVFFASRLRRIVPIAVLAVVLTALLDFGPRLVRPQSDTYVDSYSYDMVATFTWVDFVGNIVFLQPVFVDPFGSNGPLWTLGYIVQYYVIGWILCRVLGFGRMLGLVLVLITVVLMAIVSPEWAILFIAWVVGGFSRLVAIPRVLMLPFALASLALFVASNLLAPLVAATLSIAIGFLVTQAISVAPESKVLSTSRWLRPVSNDTYTVFAVHHPVLMSIFVVGFNDHVGPAPLFIAYAILCSLAIVLLSTAVNILLRAVTGRGVKSPSSHGLSSVDPPG